MAPKKDRASGVSGQTLQRLPRYLRYLRGLREKKEKYASAPMVADALCLHEVQVRKDLEVVSTTGGKPRTGFSVDELIADLEQFLYGRDVESAVLIGNGPSAKAWLAFRDWSAYGIHFAAVFDEGDAPTEQTEPPCYPISRMKREIARRNIRLAVLCTAPERAQEACDEAVDAGIVSVWNLTNASLQVPKTVLVWDAAPEVPLFFLREHRIQMDSEG